MKKHIITSAFVFLAVAGAAYASSFTWKGKLIKYGSWGQQVSDLQGCMNVLGYDTGRIDGIYGPKTYKGIKDFQKVKGYKQDGVVGPETRVGFEEACATISLDSQRSQVYNDNTPFEEDVENGVKKISLRVQSNKAYLNGVITTSTPSFVKRILTKNPKIDTLVMENVPGSLDDDANLELANWLAKKNYTFILGEKGDIASGGTDLFLAGKKRIVYDGAKIGVHSWSDGDNGPMAQEYPRGHQRHQEYIDYYMNIGWTKADAEKFYYFTIDSAPASDIHYMTNQEIIDYRITTEGRIREQIQVQKNDSQKKQLNLNTEKAMSTSEIVSSKLSDISTKVPTSLGSVYTKNFNRYAAVVAPNGKSIHIVAQNKISNEQILRARNILMHYLNNFPGSKYGSDKSAIASAMANNNAILALLNGQDDGKNKVGNRVTGQPLYQNEIQTEGGDWYMKQNYEHRDAAYEEILHFVHDNGIGVDGKNTMPGALPEYQSRIRAAQKNGLSKNLWGRGAENKSWIKELSQENSLSQEYLASAIDSYYGLWGAWSEGIGGMWDIYIAKKRSDMRQQDRSGYDVVQEFFHPYVTYNARIEPSFSGTFSLKFDSSKPYTHHSQYLKDITLLGSNNSGVVVNGFDNIITGNAGNNTVVFSGNASEYTITKNGNTTIVTDKKVNRDGKNTLIEVDLVQFKDKKNNIR